MSAHGYAHAYAGDGRPHGRRAPARRREGVAARLLVEAGRRPFRAFGILLATGMAGLIIVNAIGLQEHRHPAPIFSLKSPTPQVQGSAPAQPRASVPAEQAQQERRAPLVEPPARPQDLAAPARPAPASRDPIGDLLRGGVPEARQEARPAPTPAPAASREPELAVNSRVANAQRALTKLGYGPLKADGVVGIGTRLALENFEKDRRLPLTGELSPRVARELGAASGIAIE